ncbi:hypothetical protein BH10BDE1_BH10BDE1_02100 [soil metagenome]
MKKYILLCLFGLSSLSALVYLYSHGEATIVRNGHNIAKILLSAEKSDSQFELNLLKARGFRNINYDALVASEAEFSSVCLQMKNAEFGLYDEKLIQTRALIDDYCECQRLKVFDVEKFKSKNAIFRNSIFFLQTLSDDSMLSLESRSFDKESKLRGELIAAGLSYALVPTADSMLSLGLTLEAEKKLRQPSSDLQSVAAHAKRIFESKEELELLTERIMNSRSTAILNLLSEQYSIEHKKAAQSATVYRAVIFLFCGVLLILTGFGFLKIWNSSLALIEANANLESRVAARTLDLERAQEVVTHQQEILGASAKMSALGEMAGGVAHEINTPLAIISMRVEQMEECFVEGDFQSIDFLDAVQAIKRTTDRIAKIVSGLRTFAREGKNEPLRPVSLKPVIDETLSFCKERFANYGVRIEVAFPDDVDHLLVNARSIELSQVLLNLLNNSFDAVQAKEEKWVQIDVAERENMLELSVTDSGEGIAVEHRARLMQPFFTTKQIGKGTGLGLSISRGIVQSHGGSIEFDTSSAQTRFVIRLPKVSGEPKLDLAV